ncbi:hypothetical protein Twillingate_055 [Staphylococcus phage Twillingate]|jgi:Gp ORF044|nr:hypothetical protein Quidividi_052 [Staphylococcus phage Quidividi]AXF38491.1 hypothetical protein Twillingate_055 [Staphylococcus phage Twillingate]
MRRISPIIEKEKTVKTNNIEEVSHYLKNADIKIRSEDINDINVINKYLVSDNGKFIAKYNQDKNAVGFYKEAGLNVKHLTHVTREELGDTTFTIEVKECVDLITEVLPQGDILVKTSYEVLTIENDSVLGFIEDEVYDLDDVEEVIYTGLSKGNTENVILDFQLYKYLNN